METISQESVDVQQQSHEEPLSYDLVVEGTSLTASIVACAASRSGKTVLHLDTNDYYGSNSASFPLDEFLLWCRASKTKNDQVASARSANEGNPMILQLLVKKWFNSSHYLAPHVSTDTTEKSIFLAADSSLMQLIHFQDAGECYTFEKSDSEFLL